MKTHTIFRKQRYKGFMRTSMLPLLLASLASVSAQDKPTVVFVCEHGSAKSVIAAAELERQAKEKGLDLNILARGTNPDTEIPKPVRDGVKSDGYGIGTQEPTTV